jgi:hypothetical protein
MRLQAYSTLTGDVVDLGEPGSDLETLTSLGETAATGHDNLIVFVDRLQKWETPDD